MKLPAMNLEAIRTIPLMQKIAFVVLILAGIIVMFSGLLFIHRDNKTMAFTLIGVGASMLVGFLYAWLLSPLEEAH